jgi:uncharacterized protein YjdB
MQSLTLNRTFIEMPIGTHESLTAAIAPDNTTNKNLTWNSDDPSVATVIGGVVYAHSEGTTRITVRNHNGSRVAACTVTVTPVRVTGLRFASTSRSVLMGHDNEQRLAPIVSPPNACDRRINWSTDNPAVAMVTADGYVRGVSLGRARITATTVDGSFSATVDISVTDFPVPVTGITLSHSSVSIVRQGSGVQITATVLPDVNNPPAATNQNVIWSSNNPTVATVDKNGLVSANGPRSATGTAIITATTVDGGFTETVNVTVTPIRVTGVSLSHTSHDMFVREGAFNLGAVVHPTTADNYDVIWNSNNTAVATVDSNGVVTTHSHGTATITVTTADGGFTATCVITVSRRPAGTSGTMRLGSVGLRSVTLSSTFASTTGQTLQFAISTNPDISQNPDSLSWQAGLTFTGLANQSYYVFARAPATITNNEGFWRVLDILATGWTLRVTEDVFNRDNSIFSGNIRHTAILADGTRVELQDWGAHLGGIWAFSRTPDFAPWFIERYEVRWRTDPGYKSLGLHVDLRMTVFGQHVFDRRIGTFNDSRTLTNGDRFGGSPWNVHP